MKTGMMIRSAVAGTLLSAAGFLPAASGAIVAYFDDGNTAAAVDGYPGMAGNGWVGGWTVDYIQSVNDPDAVTIEVKSDSPFQAGSGNYLSILNDGGNREVSVDREFQSYGGVDSSQNHTVTFDLRIDDITAWEESAATWVRINAAGVAANPNSNTTSWQVLTRNHANYVYWTFRDGNRDSSTTATFVYSDVAVQEGEVYSIQLDVVPEDRSYFATVSDSLGNSWQSGELGFRTALFSGGSFLSFNNQKGSDVIDRPFGYSIDNIEIIPEPGTLALVLVPLGIGLLSRRFRAGRMNPGSRGE